MLEGRRAAVLEELTGPSVLQKLKRPQEVREVVFTVELTELRPLLVGETLRRQQLSHKRKGVVTVLELNSTSGISWKQFAHQARATGWTTASKAFEALGSGFFEGMIRAENITLHESRTKFIYDDALVDLYMALDQWFDEVGRELYDEDKRQTTEQRYAMLGMESLQRLQELLDQDGFASLKRLLTENLAGVKPPDDDVDDGTVGPGNELAPPNPNPPSGGGGGGTGNGDGTRKPPGTRSGTRSPGTRPPAVGDEAIGFYIRHEPFNHSPALWHFHVDQGVLAINVIHPVWVQLDDPDNPRRSAKNDRQIVKLQDWLIVQVFSLLKLPPELREEVRAVIDLQIKPMVELFFTT